MIHAIDLFDVFDGLVGNLPGRSRRYGEIGFEPGIHQRIDRSLRDVATTPRQLTIATPTNRAAAVLDVRRFEREMLRCARRPVTVKTFDGSQPSTAPAVDTYAGPATITPITASAAPIPSGQPTAILLSAFHASDRRHHPRRPKRR